MKKKPEVSSCIQCEGDAMLEVRKHADELIDAMNQIGIEYGHGHGRSVPQWIGVLIQAEKDQRRLVAMLRSDAERRVKEVDGLIVAMRFISDCTKESYSSGINVGGKAMTIQFTEIFRVAIERLRALTVSDRGLLDGHQPQNERNFTAELKAEAAQ